MRRCGRDLRRLSAGKLVTLSWCLAVTAVASPAVSQVDSEGQPPTRPGASYLANMPLERLTQTRDRPIFSPTRRPPPSQQAVLPVAPPPPPPPQASPPPQLTLLGMIRSTSGASAVVSDPANRTSLSLRVGDNYQGWVVQSITGTDVHLQKGSESATLAFPAGPPGFGGPQQIIE